MNYTKKEIINECKKHIKDKNGCFYTQCSKCKFFPKSIENGIIVNSVCENLSEKLGINTDYFIRNGETV